MTRFSSFSDCDECKEELRRDGIEDSRIKPRAVERSEEVGVCTYSYGDGEGTGTPLTPFDKLLWKAFNTGAEFAYDYDSHSESIHFPERWELENAFRDFRRSLAIDKMEK